MSELTEAVESGDLARAARLLAAGADPEQTIAHDTRLLAHAALRGDIALARLLLEHGADPTATDASGRTALDFAVKRNDTTLAAVLRRAISRRTFRFSDQDEKLLRDIWGSELLGAVKDRLRAPAGARPPTRTDRNDASDPDDRSHRTAQAGGHPEARNAAHRPEPTVAAEPEPEEELIREEDLIGQARAKASLRQVIALAQVNEERRSRGLIPSRVNLHAAFLGSPGTGKTTFARFYAQQIRALGLLARGHLVEVSRSDLVAEYAGQTAAKTEAVVRRALGGILFVDEAYALKQNKDDAFGQECIDTLVKEIEDHRDELVVIFAGYTNEMREFLRQNTGLQSRVPNLVEFEDFTDPELRAILEIFCKKAGMSMAPENLDFAVSEVARKRRGHAFGNAREVRNLFERALAQQSLRLAKRTLAELSREELCTLQYSDLTADGDDDLALPGDATRATSSLDRLRELVGLDGVKRELERLAGYVAVEKARNPGRGLAGVTLHMIFTGPPGTGKTTVARLLGGIMCELDLLASGHLIEVSRGDLVAGYVGQTAIRTRDRIEEAKGGVLFVDEAYTLVRGGDDFGQEALDTILKAMEDHRDQLLVVLAGYTREMQYLLDSNPGLRSRFGTFLEFPDFTLDELFSIGLSQAEDRGYALDDAAKTALRDRLAHERETESPFANGRAVRNVLEEAYRRQALRLVALGNPATLPEEQLRSLTADDLALTSTDDPTDPAAPTSSPH